MNKQNYPIIYTLKDALVLLFYRIFSFIPIYKSVRKDHVKNNITAWNEYRSRFSKDSYIEHQHALTHLKYGKRYSADYNSCEVIAVYNALVSLQKNNDQNNFFYIDFPILIENFEHRGNTCLGAFGTSPYAIIKYIRALGLCVTYYRYKKWCHICATDIIDDTAEKIHIKSSNEYDDFVHYNDTFIFMAYNNSNSIRDMIHTMCITKEGEHFQTHNDYDGAKCYPTLKAAIDGYKGGRGRMILIIGICKDSI